MFQPTTEYVDSLTIDEVTGQAVPESGTGHMYERLYGHLLIE